MYDELVKRLREGADFLELGNPGIPHNSFANMCRNAADAIEELTELSRRQEVELVELTGELASKPHWIPVTERLPDEIEDVLIYGEWTGVSGTKYREIWLTDLKGFLHQGYKPIAWRPLPEPPKEET